jgi:glycosyltransferase involved in cell wall biosynthesis
LRETRVVSGIHNISVLCRGLWKRIQEVVGTNLADMTLAVSDIDAAYYRRISFSGRPVMVLHNAIEVTDYALPIDPPPGLSRPCICMTGSMSTRANTDAALWLLDRVMPIVWKKHPELMVYIVGRLPPASLRARSSDRVIVTGQVESTAAYIRNSTVAVVPLRWESGTRFKILEAFACETPVVSTSLGAEGLPVVAGKHLLLADTPEDFAASVSRLLLESHLRSELTTNGLALVDSSFSFRKATDQVRLILAALAALRANGKQRSGV